jgi:hypothetical protein
VPNPTLNAKDESSRSILSVDLKPFSSCVKKAFVMWLNKNLYTRRDNNEQRKFEIQHTSAACGSRA